MSKEIILTVETRLQRKFWQHICLWLIVFPSSFTVFQDFLKMLFWNLEIILKFIYKVTIKNLETTWLNTKIYEASCETLKKLTLWILVSNIEIFFITSIDNRLYKTVIVLKSDRLYVMYTTPKDMERVQRPDFWPLRWCKLGRSNFGSWTKLSAGTI